jgi:CubicO group peptidase (beta-lactamase class C family)
MNSQRYLTAFVSLLLVVTFHSGRTQGLYFPPFSQSAQWDTVSPASMGWCVEKIAPLYDFLQQENTKGFLVLKDGKIALEKYFGTFDKDSLWYWASAGKTVISFLVGRAQEDGYLFVSDTSSKYLGPGWTSCTPSQEEKITIRNQLTMTSGLDDGVPDNHCTIDTCLQYLADPGTRWAYHNAPYTMLEKVLANATGQSVNLLTQINLRNKTGLTGLWVKVDYDNLFFSSVRSMARFGLLIQNRCVWNSDTLIKDTSYVNQMLSTSQAFNNSYGYLWWLNGKSSYMLPTVQIIFPGFIAPNAPADMVSGLGKNGQIVSVSKSKGIVVVRMGNQPNSPGSEIANQLCDQIWQKLNEVICNSNAVQEIDPGPDRLRIYPNPAQQSFTVDLQQNSFSLVVTDLAGRIMTEKSSVSGKIEIDSRNFSQGIYFVRAVTNKQSVFGQKFVIVKTP